MVKMTLNEWMFFGDKGASSMTIWAIANNTINASNVSKFTRHIDIPCDVSDFGRCYWLVNYCNISKETLQSVADIIPIWRPFIRKWDTLSRLYEENKKWPLLELLDECRLKKE